MRKKMKTAAKTSVFVALVWAGFTIHILRTGRKK